MGSQNNDLWQPDQNMCAADASPSSNVCTADDEFNPLSPAPTPQLVAPVARACSTSLSAWPTTLRVTVRTDFTTTLDETYWHATDGDYHTHVDGRTVGNATVEILGTTITGKTAANGLVDLDTSPLADGRHTLRITAENVSDDPVGPTIADPLSNPLPARIYRVLDVTLTTLCGAVQTAKVEPRRLSDGSFSTTHGRLGNTKLRTWDAVHSPTHLPIDLKPIWMHVARSESSRSGGSSDISLIVIHHTGYPIGTDLNTWLPATAGVSTHYVIDVDGHIIKLVKDSMQAWHADWARWGGIGPVNPYSIGIELINDDGKDYTEDQYASVIRLVQRLQTAYSIPLRRVVGHSDIAAGDHVNHVWINQKRLGRKLSDPGPNFEWERLERLGYGLIAAPGASLIGYGGVFDTPVELRRNDHDRQVGQAPVYGGVKRADISENVIKQLQSDLAGIGYSVNVTGTYDEETARAVMVFQEHYFSGSRRTAAHTRGNVNEETADAISRIRNSAP